MKPIRCILPHCNNLRKSRGLCAGCYFNARKLVLSGCTSWEQLEWEGKAAKPTGKSLGLGMFARRK